MDKLSSLNLDFDRVLIQLIIPGLTAIFPWVILFLNFHIYEKTFLIQNLSLLITLVTITSLITGLALENLGSHFEVRYYDKKNKKADLNYMITWNKFLCLNYSGHQPVGHRYLRNILLRMKFELSFAFAIIIMAIGLAILDYNYVIFNSNWLKFIIFYLGPLFISFYLLYIEGYASSKVLADTRKILVDEYYEDITQ